MLFHYNAKVDRRGKRGSRRVRQDAAQGEDGLEQVRVHHGNEERTPVLRSVRFAEIEGYQAGNGRETLLDGGAERAAGEHERLPVHMAGLPAAVLPKPDFEPVEEPVPAPEVAVVAKRREGEGSAAEEHLGCRRHDSDD